MKSIIPAALLAAVGLVATAVFPAQAADSPQEIKKQGYVIIGVRGDSRPWGYLDPSGRNVGMDIELGKDIARRLGVEARFVTVTTATRITFLQQNKIDIAIATMYDTPERRRVVRMVEPHYGSVGTALLAPRSQSFKTWSDINGKTLCGVSGSTYNTPAERDGAKVVSFTGLSEAFAALRAGNCNALIYGDLQIALELQENPDLWKDYTMPLESRDDWPWAIGIRLGSKTDELYAFLSDTVKDWHKTGYLLEENRKWSVAPTKFLTQLHEKYK